MREAQGDELVPGLRVLSLVGQGRLITRSRSHAVQISTRSASHRQSARAEAVGNDGPLQAIHQAIQGATSIVIAHRFSTVLHADKIIVMNRGGVEAIGRHADLLTSNETYSRLYRLQFAEVEPLGRF